MDSALRGGPKSAVGTTQLKQITGRKSEKVKKKKKKGADGGMRDSQRSTAGGMIGEVPVAKKGKKKKGKKLKTSAPAVEHKDPSADAEPAVLRPDKKETKLKNGEKKLKKKKKRKQESSINPQNTSVQSQPDNDAPTREANQIESRKAQLQEETKNSSSAPAKEHKKKKEHKRKRIEKDTPEAPAVVEELPAEEQPTKSSHKRKKNEEPTRAPKKQKNKKSKLHPELQTEPPPCTEEAPPGVMNGSSEASEVSRPSQRASFRRVSDEKWLGKKGAWDNSYEATFGQTGWGAKAQQIFSSVRGKDFRHQKTKKKRGTYFGGKISADAVNSIKFNSDDE